VPHPQNAPRRLAHGRKRLGQQVVQGRAVVKPRAQARRRARQFGVGERAGGWLERVDSRDSAHVADLLFGLFSVLFLFFVSLFVFRRQRDGSMVA
jgi:hypothetical protein